MHSSLLQKEMKMRLEVEKRYQTRKKGAVIITSRKERIFLGIFVVSGAKNRWHENEKDADGYDEYDIIKELPEEHVSVLPKNILTDMKILWKNRKEEQE